jgi:hypothetical protein
MKKRIQRLFKGAPSPCVDQPVAAHVPRSVDAETVGRLVRLFESCDEYLNENPLERSVNVLVPTTFNLSKSWWAHDGLLVAALRLRGAVVVPTMCDRLQSDECMIWSGVWQKSGEPGFRERRDNYCNQCVRNDLEMSKSWGLNPVRLSSYVTDGDRKHARSLVQSWIRSGDWETVVYNGYPAGIEAWKAVVNNELKAEITPSWRDRADELAYHHLFNICQLMLAYDRLLEALSIDSILGNGGFYYQWGTLQHVAELRGIPYHRYYKNWATHPLGWNYATDSHSLVDLKPAWPSWLRQPWGEPQEQRIEKHFENRGLSMDRNLGPDDERLKRFEALGIDLGKPTLLVPTGVAWDAYTNQKSVIYENMYEWLWDMFAWFAERPNYQAIVRVHPNEDYSEDVGSETRTYVEREIAIRGIAVPSNVIIVPAKHSLKSYDFVPICHACAVYTSTMGVEVACTGVPVISVGPSPYRDYGVSYDPKNREEFYSVLSQLLATKGGEHPEKMKLHARKFWYLWAYHSSIVTGLLEMGANGNHTIPELNADDLLPGANKHLDYLVDCIMHGRPVLGEDRWPPERDTRFDA